MEKRIDELFCHTSGFSAVAHSPGKRLFVELFDVRRNSCPLCEFVYDIEELLLVGRGIIYAQTETCDEREFFVFGIRLVQFVVCASVVAVAVIFFDNVSSVGSGVYKYVVGFALQDLCR